MKPDEIRQGFIDFFRQRGHSFVPSAPLILPDDPTLLFTNAGMNQFKDVFLGTATRPYRRAVNSQKCIRVSGKHNDLEEVGHDTYHHTFFEMLGNWSFGDYFKAEAIRWAWELLTEIWALPKHRLYATVFDGDEAEDLPPDDESAKLWLKLTDIDPSHVSRWGKKDNFWEMAETGPCGPCTEIHIDVTPDCSGGRLINAGSPHVLELWNLVFIEYNRQEDGRLQSLSARHVDTGMGLERLCVVLKHVEALRTGRPFRFSDYGTDLFVPLIKKIEELTGYRYGLKVAQREDESRYDADEPTDLQDVACRVIADHVRMLAFAIADGAMPGNEGRGYVVRRILRRAARFGWQHLQMRQPFIYQLVPTVVETIGQAFPEIARQPERIAAIIRDEEASFGRTLERGIVLFQQAAERAERDRTGLITAEDAFKLYDTYGFPLDLTVQMAAERRLKVDQAGFERRMAEARGLARAAAQRHATVVFEGQLPRTQDHLKYLGRQCRARVLGWVHQNRLITRGRLPSDQQVGLVLDQTCFYAEQGGQVGDQGQIATDSGLFEVCQTQRLGEGILHIGQVVSGTIEAGQTAELTVSPARQATQRNHTATHLLHWALRQALGQHVTQRGSLVEPDRLRFDFDHGEALSAGQLEQIELLVNQQVWADHRVQWYEKQRDEAFKLPGLRAFFADKYGEVVRVVEIGQGLSRELCGGTHLSRTGQIGLFKIISEEAIGKGLRRITAVTGEAALAYVQALERQARQAASTLRVGPEQVAERAQALQDELKQLRRQVQSGQVSDLRTVRQELFEKLERIGQHALIVGQLPPVAVDQIRASADWLRRKAGSAAVVLGCQQEPHKAVVIVALTADLVAGGLDARQTVRQISPLVGGAGGGKATLAQAGGR
ncbi:MAG: alanine--tRNA ligase, partial [Phycisphaerae bacterium]